MAQAQHAYVSFDGWESYPCNLASSVLDTDAKLYSDRLNKDAVRLFLSPQEVCDASVQGYSPGNGRLWLPRVKFELWNAYVYSVNRKSGQEW
jgi:hypothetical protein